MDQNKQRIEQSVTAGQTVIAVLLRNPEKISQCDLTPMMFWNSTDSIIFATISEMVDSKIPIDVVSVTEKLLEKKIGRAHV